MKSNLLEYDEIDIELIQEAYPSKCWRCKNVRRMNAKPPIDVEALERSGATGCIAPVKFYDRYEYYERAIIANERGVGISDVHAKPFSKRTPNEYANMPLNRGVSRCPFYQDISEPNEPTRTSSGSESYDFHVLDLENAAALKAKEDKTKAAKEFAIPPHQANVEDEDDDFLF